MGFKLSSIITPALTVVGGVAGFMVGGPVGAMAGASIGATVGGAISATQASKEASRIQENAANQAAQLQRETQTKVDALVAKGQHDAANKIKEAAIEQEREIRNNAQYQVATIEREYNAMLEKYAEESGVSIETLKTAIDAQLTALDEGEIEALDTLTQSKVAAGKAYNDALVEAYNELSTVDEEVQARWTAGATKALDAMEFAYDVNLAQTIKGYDEARKQLDADVNNAKAYAEDKTASARGAILSGKNSAAKILNSAESIGRSDIQGALEAATTSIKYGIDQGLSYLEKNTQQAKQTLQDKTSREDITAGFRGAIQDIQKTTPEQLAQLDKGTGKALEQIQPYSEQGKLGLVAFANSALNPNSEVFQRTLGKAQESMAKQLSARGITGPAAAKLMSDQAQELADQEYMRQVGLQQALAEMGITSSQMASEILTQNASKAVDVIARGGEATAGFRAAMGEALGGLEADRAAQIAELEAQQGQIGAQFKQRGGELISAAEQSAGAQKAELTSQFAMEKAGLDTDTASKLANLDMEVANMVNAYGMEGASQKLGLSVDKIKDIGALVDRLSSAKADISMEGGRLGAEIAQQTGMEAVNLKNQAGQFIANLESELGNDLSTIIYDAAQQRANIQGVGGGNIAQIQADTASKNLATRMGQTTSKLSAMNEASKGFQQVIGNKASSLANLDTWSATAKSGNISQTNNAIANMNMLAANAAAENKMNQSNIQSQAIQNIVSTGANLYMANQQMNTAKDIAAMKSGAGKGVPYAPTTDAAPSTVYGPQPAPSLMQANTFGERVDALKRGFGNFSSGNTFSSTASSRQIGANLNQDAGTLSKTNSTGFSLPGIGGSGSGIQTGNIGRGSNSPMTFNNASSVGGSTVGGTLGQANYGYQGNSQFETPYMYPEGMNPSQQLRQTSAYQPYGEPLDVDLKPVGYQQSPTLEQRYQNMYPNTGRGFQRSSILRAR